MSMRACLSARLSPAVSARAAHLALHPLMRSPALAVPLFARKLSSKRTAGKSRAGPAKPVDGSRPGSNTIGSRSTESNGTTARDAVKAILHEGISAAERRRWKQRGGSGGKAGASGLTSDQLAGHADALISHDNTSSTRLPGNPRLKKVLQDLSSQAKQHEGISLEWSDKWVSGRGVSTSIEDIIVDIMAHKANKGRVYIGSDSGERESDGFVVFSTAICLHGANGQRGGRYYYRRSIVPMRKKSDGSVNVRMWGETQKSVELGLLLASRCNIEVGEVELHLDLSESEKGKTKQLVSSLTGYALSYGFKAKIKPEAWAANCIADKHS